MDEGAIRHALEHLAIVDGAGNLYCVRDDGSSSAAHDFAISRSMWFVDCQSTSNLSWAASNSALFLRFRNKTFDVLPVESEELGGAFDSLPQYRTTFAFETNSGDYLVRSGPSGVAVFAVLESSLKHVLTVPGMVALDGWYADGHLFLVGMEPRRQSSWFPRRGIPKVVAVEVGSARASSSRLSLRSFPSRPVDWGPSVRAESCLGVLHDASGEPLLVTAFDDTRVGLGDEAMGAYPAPNEMVGIAVCRLNKHSELEPLRYYERANCYSLLLAEDRRAAYFTGPAVPERQLSGLKMLLGSAQHGEPVQTDWGAERVQGHLYFFRAWWRPKLEIAAVARFVFGGTKSKSFLCRSNDGIRWRVASALS